MRRVFLLLLALCAMLLPLAAEEGMWTYDNFPASKVKRTYGFAPDQAWLDNARLSSLRFGMGCSSSFVSPEGLIMTNHHCARSCIQSISTAERNYIASGFYAQTQADEKRCPGLEAGQLVEIHDVTPEVNAATKGLSGAKLNEALDAVKAKLAKSCGVDTKVRCDVVTLYAGGRYDLYKYRRYDDVRLVFAPEEEAAFFGGDPDNFNFPRYDFDVSFLRAYENNAPVKTEHYFKWSEGGPKAGDMTFISGHPGRTERAQTVAQLEYERDYTLPRMIAFDSEIRGLLTEYEQRGAEEARTANTGLFGVENSLKVYKGRQEALVDPAAFGRKVAEERALRAKVNADPKLKQAYGQAWDNIAAAVKRERELSTPYTYIERGRGFDSRLYQYARTLVRAGEELPKPNEKRLPEFADSQLSRLRHSMASPTPVYPELEIETLTFSLTKLREALGPDDPFVHELFGKRSPREIAAEAVKGSGLADPAVRKQLLDGGETAVNASTDPLILLAKTVDPYARKLRKQYEDEVESVYRANGELLGKARFAVFGTSIYPDATGTLRLSVGQVKGWEENGRPVPPMTIIGGSYERATGRDPFRLPESWIRAKDKLNLETPLNFVSTNDIIGGNSGSPVINREGQIVGLVFDGNIHSLGGDYWFDETTNRAVSVDSAALLEGLDKVYGASRVIDEIRPK